MADKLRIIEAPSCGYEIQKLELIGNQCAPVWKRLYWGPTIGDCEIELAKISPRIISDRERKIIDWLWLNILEDAAEIVQGGQGQYSCCANRAKAIRNLKTSKEGI